MGKGWAMIEGGVWAVGGKGKWGVDWRGCYGVCALMEKKRTEPGDEGRGIIYQHCQPNSWTPNVRILAPRVCFGGRWIGWNITVSVTPPTALPAVFAVPDAASRKAVSS